ncbi:hypothetical protein HNR42_000679 [Deinobacterium chartae]|uniref:Uncharacterized protein n=1 Tax=Deinobacterium chartae TaxID=521158 RepID=A0A841HZU8_9DEIO|nr:hypothetical protein [Deinobacterium chartae]MBB6097265.1 hypothetical protein [Deinobacterium chartae]
MKKLSVTVSHSPKHQQEAKLATSAILESIEDTIQAHAYGYKAKPILGEAAEVGRVYTFHSDLSREEMQTISDEAFEGLGDNDRFEIITLFGSTNEEAFFSYMLSPR